MLNAYTWHILNWSELESDIYFLWGRLYTSFLGKQPKQIEISNYQEKDEDTFYFGSKFTCNNQSSSTNEN